MRLSHFSIINIELVDFIIIAKIFGLIIKSMMTNEQTLMKIFNPENKQLKIDFKLLYEICQDKNFKLLIDLISVLEKVLLTGSKKMSIRQIIQTNTTFKSKISSSYQKYQTSLEHKSSQELKQNKNIQNSKNKMFMVQQLNSQEKDHLIRCIKRIKQSLKHTVYEIKISFILFNLLGRTHEHLGLSEIQAKKIINLHSLATISSKTQKCLQFLTNCYKYLDGKFVNFYSLFYFISEQILPIMERQILSISINDHRQRQNSIRIAIDFLANFFIHQYQLEIKINRATLIQNRIFVEKIFKQNFKKNQILFFRNTTKIINEALLCPSVMEIQLPLFRILKRMYYLWSCEVSGSNQLIQFKSQTDNLGGIIKYPLFTNLRNISLFSQAGSQDTIKQVAMFCYKIVQQKNDLEFANQIQNSDELRYIKQAKYYCSKAYAFSDQIFRIYDTFDLKLPFWHYQKHFQSRQIWTYNVIIQKPNSLFVWQFYLQNYDIRFGLYKVQDLSKHTIQQFNQQLNCKQIIKLEKLSPTQTSKHQGTTFLKNGFYKVVFDNSYSVVRGKDLIYMFLQLQSEG